MTHEEAKEILRGIGINGAEFSRMMGRSKNYVTDLKRTGVSKSMVAVFNMMEALYKHGVSKEEILKLLPVHENKE